MSTIDIRIARRTARRLVALAVMAGALVPLAATVAEAQSRRQPTPLTVQPRSYLDPGPRSVRDRTRADELNSGLYSLHLADRWADGSPRYPLPSSLDLPGYGPYRVDWRAPAFLMR